MALLESPHDKTNKMTVRPAKTQNTPCSSCGQWSLWSDWVDAQVDLSLRWAHMPVCWFCYVAAHFKKTHPPSGQQWVRAVWPFWHYIYAYNLPVHGIPVSQDSVSVTILVQYGPQQRPKRVLVPMPQVASHGLQGSNCESMNKINACIWYVL